MALANRQTVNQGEIAMGIKIETITRKTVTDDLTGADVQESEVTELPFTFGDTSGHVYLTAESVAKINALPEFAALISAARENKPPKSSNGASGPSKQVIPGTTDVHLIDMRTWARETGFKRTDGSDFPKSARMPKAEVTRLTEAYLAAHPEKRANAEANGDASTSGNLTSGEPASGKPAK